MAKTKNATASTARYRVVRPIQHGKVLLAKGDIVDLNDDQAGHLLLTRAIEIIALPIQDGDVVDLSDADAQLVVLTDVKSVVAV